MRVPGPGRDQGVARVRATHGWGHAEGWTSREAEPDITTPENAVRPFTVQIRDDALDDLRRRLMETRWPSKELVDDRSQGVQLDAVQALCEYWVKEYEGRRVESLRATPFAGPEVRARSTP